MFFILAKDFNEWRNEARKLLQAHIHPSQVLWNTSVQQESLFANNLPEVPIAQPINVPSEFIERAQIIALHRSEERFSLLYHMLWRLAYEDRNLLHILSDPLTHKLHQMQKAIQRDVHKTKAFVRFRKTIDDYGEEHYIAWHKPDHYTLRLSAPFFQRRFSIMRWTILTPDESVHWDGTFLHFGPAAYLSEAPDGDQMEELWKTFYKAIFNPARIKIKTMKREMPIRHWATLPETSVIHELLQEAPERVKAMIAHQEGHACSAIDFIPLERSLNALKEAAFQCKGCALYQQATQTVFGTGPAHARLMLVGEQPGDEEDKTGEPFHGPAGQILDRALEEAELDRSALYITNAVKHFKFSTRGTQRLHRTPNVRDIVACKPWLEAELIAIQPKLIVCLGVTAARALINPNFKLNTSQGEILFKEGVNYLPTFHPSAVLRAKEPVLTFQRLVQALKKARLFVYS